MAVQITMPKLGLSMVEGTVAKWLVREGEAVKKGQPLVEVMTDKITSEVEAPANGILLKIMAEKKVKLPIGGVLGIVGDEGESIEALVAVKAEQSPANQPAAEIKLKISPAARKLAEENGIDYARITGSGPEGRITKEDIQQAVAAKDAHYDERPVWAVTPYEGMRRVIGDNMSRSWSMVPKVTQHVGVDVSALQEMRAAMNDGRKESEKISLTALLVYIVARALQRHAHINATLSGDEIRILKNIHVGVAVAVPDGLVVPVVRDADSKSIAEINNEINDFAKRARKNKLGPDDMTGGTFTITNLGAYGSVDGFTPIINQPESAILGIGRTVKRPVVVEDQIVIRPVMGLSFAFDHRVIDGAPAAEFLADVIRLIEQPYKLFLT